MEDEEIEKLLQESAKNLKIKDFSERWEEIKDRLLPAAEVAQKETEKEAVLVNSANGNVSSGGFKRRIIYILCAAFLAIAVCLAIVLPIVLKKGEEPVYFSLDELIDANVLESEFYDKIDESNLEVADFSQFDCGLYVLLNSPDDVLMGGKLELVDESAGVMINVCFYKNTVTSDFDVGEQVKECVVNDCKIQYSTELNDSFYTTKAKTQKKDIVYELNCITSDEDVAVLFQKIFS